MFPYCIISAALILVLFILVLVRALNYINRHPELLTNASPPSYYRCQQTLSQVIARYHEIESQVTSAITVTWGSPYKRRYTLNSEGITEHGSSFSADYHLAWPRIGGIGIWMQPGFQSFDKNHDGSTDIQLTTGYSFHLLIVPHSGRTLDIPIPTNENSEAVEFAAYTLALTERMGKRINVFGFDKPPAPPRRRVPKV